MRVDRPSKGLPAGGVDDPLDLAGSQSDMRIIGKKGQRIIEHGIRNIRFGVIFLERFSEAGGYRHSSLDVIFGDIFCKYECLHWFAVKI